MSEETAAKIEPTLTPVTDAPSIAADAPEATETAKVEPKIEPKIESKPEAASSEPAKAEPAASSAKEPVMPRAAQISPEPLSAKAAPIWLRPVRADEKDEEPEQAARPAPSRAAGRFALLAAIVAITASIGAIAGSFGGAVFGRPPLDVHAAASKDTGDEIRALKETVAQLRTHTKTLADNVAALKLSVSNTSAQLTKINESIERRAAPAAAPETTGSITKQQAPVMLGAPPSNLQHPVVQGWTLRRVFDGTALIEGREGVIEVEPGITIPGLGRIEDIKRVDGRWAVLTSKGIIVAAR